MFISDLQVFAAPPGHVLWFTSLKDGFNKGKWRKDRTKVFGQGKKLKGRNVILYQPRDFISEDSETKKYDILFLITLFNVQLLGLACRFIKLVCSSVQSRNQT